MITRASACCLFSMLSVSAASVEKPVAAAADQPVRIAIPYSAPDKGYVSLALFNQAGSLVSSLLSAQYVEKGARTVVWDATTDLGTVVPAGTYTAKAAYFKDPPSLTYLMKVSKDGTPPYRTPDGKGDWGGNLGPATGICANKTSLVSAWVCVEDNQITGVQQMDANGAVQMRYSTFYPWDCRWACAMDERNLYLGILKDRKELQIAAYTLGSSGGRILLTLVSEETTQPNLALSGMALTEDRIYATVGFKNQLFIIERSSGKILKTIDAPSANGLGIQGDRLLVVSGEEVLRFTLDGTSDGVFLKKGELKSPGALCIDTSGSVYVSDGVTKQIHVFDRTGKHVRALGKLGGAADTGAYDGANGFGDNLWMCMSPDGKSLFINDIATGFGRTSRWSLTGTMEKEWFTGCGDNYGPPINPSRPQEVLKLGSEFGSGNIMAWEIDVAKKTWRPAWRYTQPQTESWHDDVIRGFEHGGLPLKKEMGFPGTWPIFAYGASGGVRTAKGRNYMLAENGAIYTYGPDAAPKLVAMVCPHRCDIDRDKKFVQTYYASGSDTWVTWADRSGDGKPQFDEVMIAEHNPLIGNAGALRCVFDEQMNIIVYRWMDPDLQNGQPAQMCRLPLLEILPTGAPVYDWNKVEAYGPPLAKPNLQGGDPTKVTTTPIISFVDSGSLLYALIEPSGDHPKMWGIDGDGWWASRNWRKKIACFDKATGLCRWAVGRRAAGVARPGEMYNPMAIAGAAGHAVFAADALGVVWAWDEDGLYLGRLYNGPEDRRADDQSLYIELMGARIVMFGERILLFANDTGTSVHEVHLPKRQPLTIAPVTVTAEQVARAKTWNPDGAPPSEKPVYHAQSLALHHAEVPMTIDGDINPKEGWRGLSDGTKVEDAQIMMDNDRVAWVRALYDDTNLYLSFDVRSANGPVNAGTELPICPFVSGAYVDASFAPNWAEPQRPQPLDGDVRVLVAQIAGKDGAVPFQRGYWQKKAGGKGGQTITSPAASIHMDQIAEIPGLQQAWKVSGSDDGGKHVNWQMELSIPLAAIGLTNAKGRSIGFDTSIGIANAAGNGRERAAHWGGLNEAAVVDRPGSSQLLPENWGTLIFVER